MTSKQAAANQTRSRLIDAAAKTILRHGLPSLTLDTVAREAGVSKGGLLHHFPSKDALMAAILEQLFADFETRARRYYEQEDATPGRWLRAYVRATFDEDPLPLNLSAILLVAVAENDSLLRLLREDAAHWQARLVSDCVPPVRATIIRRAADAAWTERLIDPAPNQQRDRGAVMDELLRLTRADL
jgi:AcrR family transcriptional regulator